MTAKTEQLSEREIAKIDAVPIFNPLQKATLAASKRTGIRLGLSVAGGTYHVEALAFALRNGRAAGAPDARRLASFPTSDVPAVIAYLDAMA